MSMQATYVSKSERSVPAKDGKPARTFYNVSLDFPEVGTAQVGVDEVTYRVLDSVQRFTEVDVEVVPAVWNGRAEFRVKSISPLKVGKA